MSDTLQLVVNVPYSQPGKNWRLSSVYQFSFGVECWSIDDRLKHIGHSLSNFWELGLFGCSTTS